MFVLDKDSNLIIHLFRKFHRNQIGYRTYSLPVFTVSPQEQTHIYNNKYTTFFQTKKINLKHLSKTLYICNRYTQYYISVSNMVIWKLYQFYLYSYLIEKFITTNLKKYIYNKKNKIKKYQFCFKKSYFIL